MDLPNTFLWLDIDGVILDWVKLKQYLSREIFDQILQGGAEKFWEIYEGLRDATGQVDFGKALGILVEKYQFDPDLLMERIKNIKFDEFVFPDFIIFARNSLSNFGGFGLFSQGTVWYQMEKVLDLSDIFPNKPNKVFVSEDKTKLFDKMRSVSLECFSVYVEDRLAFLKGALSKKAVDLGIFMARGEAIPNFEKENIFPVDNFASLMPLLKR